MPRRMACALTVDSVRARTKTVTRRHPDTWRDLKPGDRLTLIEKGMGLPKGAQQVVLATVEVISNRVEPLRHIAAEGELEAEGLPGMSAFGFMLMWADSHGYRNVLRGDLPDLDCRRIEWRYLDEEGTDA